MRIMIITMINKIIVKISMVIIIITIVVVMIPIYVTLEANDILHGDDVHKLQQPDPPWVLHTTSIDGNDDNI